MISPEMTSLIPSLEFWNQWTHGMSSSTWMLLFPQEQLIPSMNSTFKAGRSGIFPNDLEFFQLGPSFVFGFVLSFTIKLFPNLGYAFIWRDSSSNKNGIQKQPSVIMALTLKNSATKESSLKLPNGMEVCLTLKESKMST